MSYNVLPQKFVQVMRPWPYKIVQWKSYKMVQWYLNNNLKNEYHLKNEDNLKNEDDLKN